MMALGDHWCTVDEVKALLAEPYPPDDDIEDATGRATAVLAASFCIVPADTDPENGYPDDIRVRTGCAIMAAQWIIAAPMGSPIPSEGIESETIGGYSYKTRLPGRTRATALRIDGVVKEMVFGYLCSDGQGVYEIDTLVDRHRVEYIVALIDLVSGAVVYP